MTKPALSVDRIRDLFNYDPASGVFTRRVTNRRWKAGQRAGSVDVNGHILLNIDGVQYRAHRVAWLYVTGSEPSGDIDHINGVRSDNRFSNLRDVSRRVNLQNRRSAKEGRLLGAHWRADVGLWRSTIRAEGKQVSLGYFKSAEAAHGAYVAAKRRMHEGCTI